MQYTNSVFIPVLVVSVQQCAQTYSRTFAWHLNQMGVHKSMSRTKVKVASLLRWWQRPADPPRSKRRGGAVSGSTADSAVVSSLVREQMICHPLRLANLTPFAYETPLYSMYYMIEISCERRFHHWRAQQRLKAACKAIRAQNYRSVVNLSLHDHIIIIFIFIVINVTKEKEAFLHNYQLRLLSCCLATSAANKRV